QTDSRENDANQIEALVDVTTHQQLLGCASFEIKAVSRGSHFRNIQIGLCSFGRTAGIYQCVCQTAFEVDKFGAARRRKFEGPAVKSSSAIKRQRARRLLCCNG